MALRPNVIHSFPELSNARQPEELGAMLSFRGSLLGGCFYLDETLVDYKRSMGSLVVDYRSRETCRESLFADLLATHGIPVERGIFGADMKVELLNDGPVTLWLESPC